MKKWVLRFRQVDKATFDAIANGTKSIETRAATPKYQKIHAGDILVFDCNKQRFEKHIKSVQHFPTIESMLDTIPIQNIMPNVTSLEEAKQTYYAFPDYEQKIKDNGLLAFELTSS